MNTTKPKRVTKFSTKTNGLLNYSDFATFKGKIIYAIIFLLMLTVSLICLVPVIWVAVSGFKDVSEMYAIPPTFFPKHFDFGKLLDFWNRVNVFKYFKNSLILIVGCLSFDIIANGLAGYVLSRIKPVGARVIEKMIFASMLLSGVSLIPLYISFVDVPFFHINLSGSYLPIWMMAGANAFNVLLFRNFFNGIPMSYLEAARIDGCTDLGIFGRIIVPMSKPIIMVVSIFSITGTWSNFMWPYLILGSTEKEPVSVMLYTLTSTVLRDDESMLLTMISIVPMIIVYAFFSKYIIGGVNMSGLKG
ncbi:MAG: carbohydrate ABC transporter permease [Clostridia bacterium]|nr:carbohydrate ABC transporter permease [Clostridia bacterium]